MARPIQLEPEERQLLLDMLRPHLDYYRLLSSDPKASSKSRAKFALLKALEAKLCVLTATE